MHSFARHRHSRASKATAKETKGLILNEGWSYDLGIWFIDTFMFRGQLQKMRQRTANVARLQPGEQVLDVGCGTGTLAMEVARRGAVRAASQALTRGPSRSPVRGRKLLDATCPSSSRPE